MQGAQILINAHVPREAELVESMGQSLLFWSKQQKRIDRRLHLWGFAAIAASSTDRALHFASMPSCTADFRSLQLTGACSAIRLRAYK